MTTEQTQGPLQQQKPKFRPPPPSSKPPPLPAKDIEFDIARSIATNSEQRLKRQVKQKIKEQIEIKKSDNSSPIQPKRSIIFDAGQNTIKDERLKNEEEKENDEDFKGQTIILQKKVSDHDQEKNIPENPKRRRLSITLSFTLKNDSLI